MAKRIIHLEPGTSEREKFSLARSGSNSASKYQISTTPVTLCEDLCNHISVLSADKEQMWNDEVICSSSV
jgi:hypothetical protein